MDSTYYIGSTYCSVIITETKFSLVVNSSQTYIHDSTNNLLHCEGPDGVGPTMDFFLQKGLF